MNDADKDWEYLTQEWRSSDEVSAVKRANQLAEAGWKKTGEQFEKTSMFTELFQQTWRRKRGNTN